jgi:hypothetical protein
MSRCRTAQCWPRRSGVVLFALLAFWLVLLPKTARASVPICSELAMTDFAPAPMISTKTAEIWGDGACNVPAGTHLDAADPHRAPQILELPRILVRALPIPTAWPPRAEGVALPRPTPERARAAPDQGRVFRPPCSQRG